MLHACSLARLKMLPPQIPLASCIKASHIPWSWDFSARRQNRATECIEALLQRTQHLQGRCVNDSPNVQIYKDSNHKPEMAIAITDFEALCGFVPHQELKDALQSVPELRKLIGDVKPLTFSLPSPAYEFA